MQGQFDDKTLIQAFVSYLAIKGHPGLQVDKWPDDENRESPDIDAIAGQFAIEHTSIDTIPKQRRDSAWFVRAVGGLEGELGGKLTYRLSLILPYEGIQKGQNWSAIRFALHSWIQDQSPRLPDGNHTITGIPGIPFDFRVVKSVARRPGLLFARTAPEDDSLPVRVREQLDRKAEKLTPYKGHGNFTILLLESDDIALMNESVMIEGIRAAYSGRLPEGVDQIWFADTSIPTEIEFLDLTPAIIN